MVLVNSVSVQSIILDNKTSPDSTTIMDGHRSGLT